MHSTVRHTHTQPFYGSVDFVWDNPGEPVPEKHSPTTLIVVISHPCLLSPSTTIHCILPIQSTCFTVFFHNLSPSFLWSTCSPGTLHFILHTFLHTAATAWVVSNELCQRRSKSGSALILPVREKMQFLHFSNFPGSVETSVKRGGITNYRSIAYSLCNISAKNYQNRLMCFEVIVCNISVIFRHSVVYL